MKKGTNFLIHLTHLQLWFKNATKKVSRKINNLKISSWVCNFEKVVKKEDSLITKSTWTHGTNMKNKLMTILKTNDTYQVNKANKVRGRIQSYRSCIKRYRLRMRHRLLQTFILVRILRIAQDQRRDHIGIAPSMLAKKSK